jgi:addiction module HigA family antidote
MTPYALAAACRVPRTRFERLANERARVSPDTALRLGRYFGTTPGFWLAIQAHYDIETVSRIKGKDIEAIQPHI